MRAHKSIFKHYLFPITLNVHLPHSCFLKIKTRVRSHHAEHPNYKIFATEEAVPGTSWHSLPVLQKQLQQPEQDHALHPGTQSTGASAKAAPRNSASEGARDTKGISAAPLMEKSSS